MVDLHYVSRQESGVHQKKEDTVCVKTKTKTKGRCTSALP